MKAESVIITENSSPQIDSSVDLLANHSRRVRRCCGAHINRHTVTKYFLALRVDTPGQGGRAHLPCFLLYTSFDPYYVTVQNIVYDLEFNHFCQHWSTTLRPTCIAILRNGHPASRVSGTDPSQTTQIEQKYYA